MRAAAVLLTVVATVAVGVLAVDLTEDRQTLVPPPDAVAEQFVRQILAGRSEQALPFLSEKLRPRVSADRLDDLGGRLETELGEVAKVSAELESISGDRAAASAALDGARGSRTFRFGLVREQGEWTIGEAGDLLREAPTAPPI